MVLIRTTSSRHKEMGKGEGDALVQIELGHRLREHRRLNGLRLKIRALREDAHQ